MCDPISILIGTSLVGGAARISASNKAAKDRAESAADAREMAARAKRDEDLNTIKSRGEDYASRRRTRTSSNPTTAGLAVPAASRSFFAAA